MKIGIVGIGMVGATAAYTLVMRGIGSEIVLINRNARRAQKLDTLSLCKSHWDARSF